MSFISNISAHITDLIFYPLKKSKQISVLYILNSLAQVGAVPNQLLQRVKPWPNGPASSRKWMQVELAYKLALGSQTACSFLRKYTQVTKKDILRQTILYFIG